MYDAYLLVGLPYDHVIFSKLDIPNLKHTYEFNNQEYSKAEEAEKEVEALGLEVIKVEYEESYDLNSVAYIGYTVKDLFSTSDELKKLEEKFKRTTRHKGVFTPPMVISFYGRFI